MKKISRLLQYIPTSQKDLYSKQSLDTLAGTVCSTISFTFKVRQTVRCGYDLQKKEQSAIKTEIKGGNHIPNNTNLRVIRLVALTIWTIQG